jgi:hypothetical protein
VISIYFSPYLIWGQDCLIRIGDNLDANIPYFKVIAQNAHSFGWSYDTVPQVMNGLPKSAFLTQWNLAYLLFFLFAPFTAYVIHLVLIGITAFLGMLWLLKTLWTDREGYKDNIIVYGVALCFSILPFYPSAGISIAGQPLLFLAFLNIHKGNLKLWNFIVIFFFPFYSSLVFAGVFIFIIIGFWGIYKLIFRKGKLLPFAGAGILLVISYFITEQNLILNFLLKRGFISIVDDQGLFISTFADSIKETVQLLIYGFPAHANIFQFPVILFTILAAFILLLFLNRTHSPIFYFLIILTLVFALFSAFYKWSQFTVIKEQISILKSFDFSRFSFFLPFLFYLLFFYSLRIFSNSFKNVSILLVSLILLQVGFNFKRNINDRTLYYEIHKMVLYDRKTSCELTYRQYYSEAIFKEMKNYINADPATYRTLSLGIDPGVMIYNGFYTLDGYNSYYPLEYKKAFRKIIAKEILKSESIRIDFDVEGSLCYLFSSELTRGKCYTKTNPVVVNNLEINTEQIKIMGGRYLVSAVEISNYAQNSLSFLQVFNNEESLYKIFLYEVLYIP